MPHIILPEIEEVKVKLDGSKIALVSSKGGVIKVPWQVAKVLAKAIVTQAGIAEEWANKDKLVFDQALLQRTGAPIGLTSNPVIQKAAMHEAQYNDKLRKYLPGGVKSKSVVGTPAVIKHPPPKTKEASDGKAD